MNLRVGTIFLLIFTFVPTTEALFWGFFLDIICSLVPFLGFCSNDDDDGDNVPPAPTSAPTMAPTRPKECTFGGPSAADNFCLNSQEKCCPDNTCIEQDLCCPGTECGTTNSAGVIVGACCPIGKACSISQITIGNPPTSTTTAECV